MQRNVGAKNKFKCVKKNHRPVNRIIFAQWDTCLTESNTFLVLHFHADEDILIKFMLANIVHLCNVYQVCEKNNIMPKGRESQSQQVIQTSIKDAIRKHPNELKDLQYYPAIFCHYF